MTIRARVRRSGSRCGVPAGWFASSGIDWSYVSSDNAGASGTRPLSGIQGVAEMKRAFALLAAVAIWGATGCGINGTWTLQSVEPEEARGQFKLAEVTFNADGTYSAVADYADEEAKSAGTYTFKAGKLVLHTDHGTTREYDAELCAPCNTLKVSTVEHDQTVTATMTRKK
ncbi:MAG: hypothetical protein D6744_11380 [Planctomycetota bacterium]|nr:MAG: hypothetical protein D6744_11380 [Planctomycetota bacterium]